MRASQRIRHRPLRAEIYGWFTEGLDPADRKEAKVLLGELSCPPTHAAGDAYRVLHHCLYDKETLAAIVLREGCERHE